MKKEKSLSKTKPLVNEVQAADNVLQIHVFQCSGCPHCIVYCIQYRLLLKQKTILSCLAENTSNSHESEVSSEQAPYAYGTKTVPLHGAHSSTSVAALTQCCSACGFISYANKLMF